MKTPEADLKDKVKALLRSISQLWFFMPVPFGYGVKGIPDFIGCWRGRFFAIETKAFKNKETPWQTLIRNKILAAGGLAIAAYTIEDVKAMFENAIQRKI